MVLFLNGMKLVKVKTKQIDRVCWKERCLMLAKRKPSASQLIQNCFNSDSW